MPKYIDFDALGVQSCNPDVFVNKGYAEGWNSLMRMLYDASASDVVPVVRCKDCKYKPTAPDGITHGLQVEFPDKWANRCPCLCEDGWYSWVPDDNFFCAYGAKEENDDLD